jgi:hypothetical protein
MGYEEQLKEAERILDKMNAARQPTADLEKWMKEVDTGLGVLVLLWATQCAAVVILIIILLSR